MKYNELSEAQEELLSCLSEECAEVIFAKEKIIRFGLNSHHPETGMINKDHLRKKLAQLLFWITQVCITFELDDDEMAKDFGEKEDSSHEYLHSYVTQER